MKTTVGKENDSQNEDSTISQNNNWTSCALSEPWSPNVNVREGKTSSVGKYLEDHRWGREQFEPLLRLSSSDTKVAHDAPLLWIVATRAAAEPERCKAGKTQA